MDDIWLILHDNNANLPFIAADFAGSELDSFQFLAKNNLP